VLVLRTLFDARGVHCSLALGGSEIIIKKYDIGAGSCVLDCFDKIVFQTRAVERFISISGCWCVCTFLH
jgi:hypothetical protein